jgi:hypothetical protein
MVLVVGDAAALQGGRRQPEPEWLYAAMQANSFAEDAGTWRGVQCM